MYNLVIKNGLLADGTGNPPYYADIAIENGKIVRIAKGIECSEQTIDVKGLVVSPGFIDSHSHSDSAIFTYPDQIEKIEQGITTSIGGNCGISPAPTDKENTMGIFLERAQKEAQGSNIALFVGHSALRCAVMGMDNRAPSNEELNEMKELLRDGLEHGALGISFGLIYPPSCYAETDELVALAEVIAQYNGIISAHIRNESEYLVKATEEFIHVLKTTGTRGVLSHHKAAYQENWGKVSHTLRMIEEASKQGVEIYCDVYPYTASSTSLSARFIPKEYHSKGSEGIVAYLSDPVTCEKIKKGNIDHWGTDLSWVQITSCPAYPAYEGLSIPEIAKIHGKDEYDTIFDLIKDGKNVCQASFFSMCEEDIKQVLAYHRTMICTDSGVAGAKKAYHPRLRGSFPRVLGRYVREQQVTTLPEMIRKMTSLPANVYGLKKKGLLLEGFDADLCIFDPDTIIDKADFKDCHQKAIGLHYVILNGEIVVTDGNYLGNRKGNVILRMQ